MELQQYQDWATQTDQFGRDQEMPGAEHPTKSETIPLLGLIGEVGSLAVEYKKLLRDGPVHSLYGQNLIEELGDILWYVANVATKAGLRLEDIAEANLRKTRDRFIGPKRHTLYDEALPPDQQLPRTFVYQFSHKEIKGLRRMVITDIASDISLGSPLTDNSHQDDGYRFHDAMHMAFASCLGWSPVLRKLLRDQGRLNKRFSHEDSAESRAREEAEDGGRAQVVEEAIVYLADAYYSRHPDAKSLDFQLLRYIKDLTSQIEVSTRTEAEWEKALLQGFAVWRDLRTNDGGLVEANLHAGTVRFVAASSDQKKKDS